MFHAERSIKARKAVILVSNQNGWPVAAALRPGSVRPGGVVSLLVRVRSGSPSAGDVALPRPRGLTSLVRGYAGVGIGLPPDTPIQLAGRSPRPENKLSC